MAKTKFNRTNENVDWAKWTWNPVVGCLHGCRYCYARDIAKRFYGHFKPTFFPERLEAPVNTSPIREPGGNMVFVCSMADLFGEWVEQGWIDAVIEAVRNSPQWTFLFLTKNPSRLATVQWSDNAWVGTTIDCQARVKKAEDAFSRFDATVKFVSCEPLQEEIRFNRMDLFDWMIVGGRSRSTKMKAGQPEHAWVHALIEQAREVKTMIYCKPNLTAVDGPKEYPK